MGLHISTNGGQSRDALNVNPFSSEGGLVIDDPIYCLKFSEEKSVF